MGKIVLQIFVTVDGVVDGEGRARLMSWNPRFSGEQFSKQVRDQLLASEAMLLGRKTYEGFAAAWPPREPTSDRATWTVDDEIANRINSLPKFVASTTLTGPLEWNATLLQGDLATEVARLKGSAEQDILVYGGGEFTHALMRHNLIDEYHLLVFPVLVGRGVRLFTDDADATLDPVDSTTLDTGILSVRYRSNR